MTVYGYARWSSLEQGRGSTLERQLEKCHAYAETRGWTISETLVDRGRSAYTGANIETGELGRFAQQVTAGAITSPTLIVEELDRLSRQPADVMLTWLSPLVRKGLTIVVTATGQVIDRNMLDHDMGGLMMILITAFGSHKESKKKADRVGAAWEKKRRDASAGGTVQVNHRHPQWLWVRDGVLEPHPDRLAIVKRIFELRLQGHGKASIAKRLNEDRVPTWGATKRKAEAWTATYVGRVLCNRAVLGEWQPHSQPRGGERKPIGDPITGYYPEIISPEVFARANDKRDEHQRRHQGRGRSLSNLLGSRPRCGDCGGLMAAMGSARYRTNKDGSQTRHYFLYCSNAKVAKTCTNQRGWTYDRVEGPILDAILALAMDDQHFAITDEAAPIEAEVYTIRNEVEALEARIARLADELEISDDADLRVRYRARKTELQAARDRLTEANDRLALARGKASPAEHMRRVSEVRSLMTDDDPDIRYQARAKVKAALGGIIESISFDPYSGNAVVMLVDRLRMFAISHAGEVISNVDLKAMFPDEVGPGYGKVTTRYAGKTSYSNDLTAEQHEASKAYLRRSEG